MRRFRIGCSVLALSLSILVLFAPSLLAKGFSYPNTRRTDQTDDYHGTQVADPYRWLEDSDSPEVKSWIDSENAVTRAYIDKTGFVNPIKQQLKARLDYVR